MIEIPTQPNGIFIGIDKPNNAGKGVLQRIIANRNFKANLRRIRFTTIKKVQPEVTVSAWYGLHWYMITTELPLKEL